MSTEDCQSPNQIGPDTWERCGGCAPCLRRQLRERDAKLVKAEAALAQCAEWSRDHSVLLSPKDDPRLHELCCPACVVDSYKKKTRVSN